MEHLSIVELITLVSAVLGVGLWLIKQGMNTGKILNRVKELEECKVYVEDAEWLTTDSHEKLTVSCRHDIYKDINNLREDFKDLELCVKASESIRVVERKQDEARWRRTEDSLLKITTLLEYQATAKALESPKKAPLSPWE